MNQHDVIKQCKQVMAVILENDRDLSSVDAAKAVWQYAVSFAARQPKTPSLEERLDRIEKAAAAILGEMGGMETRASKRLEDALCWNAVMKSPQVQALQKNQ